MSDQNRNFATQNAGFTALHKAEVVSEQVSSRKQGAGNLCFPAFCR
jgi:hypothetical protein